MGKNIFVLYIFMFLNYKIYIDMICRRCYNTCYKRSEEIKMENNYVYPAKIREEDGEFILEFIDFPDLFISSEKKEDIIRDAQEVLALELIDCIDTGREIPSPTMAESDVIYVHVWLPYFKNLTKEVYVKKTVTIPAWLDLLAKERNVNFSACMVRGVKEELGIQ